MRPDFIRVHQPLEHTRILPILLIGLALIAPLLSPSAAAEPAHNELGNNVGRIVYNIPGEGSFDVYAVSFQMPVETEDQKGDWR